MALDFPSSPTNGTQFTGPGGAIWVYDGVKWAANSAAAPGDITAVNAGTGLSGGGLSGDVTLNLVSPVTIANGGTNATTAPAALTSLGIPTPFSIANGGTGATTATAALVNLGGTLNDVGRNLIHNSLFNVQQRGAGPWTGPTNTYTVDRWQIGGASGDAITASVTGLTDTARTQIGDEAARNSVTLTFTGASGAGNWIDFWHNIEGVRRLGGKTVIVSFYAAANTGSPKIGVSIDQGFGTGGSPSGYVSGIGQSVTLTNAWARYSFVFTIASTSGKTLGTNNNDVTVFNLWLSGGANANSGTGSIGVQSGTIQLWGVQLEIAQPGQTQPTALEKPDPADDLAKCQRFYYASGFLWFSSYSAAGANFGQSVLFPTTMRAIPTIAFIGPAYGNASGIAAFGTNTSAVGIYAVSTAAGQANWQINGFTASADL